MTASCWDHRQPWSCKLGVIRESSHTEERLSEAEEVQGNNKLTGIRMVFFKNRQQVRAIGDFLIAKLLKILEDNSRLDCNSFSAATLKTAADVPAPGFL